METQIKQKDIICQLDFTKTISGYQKLTNDLNQFIQVFEVIMDAPFNDEAYGFVKVGNLQAIKDIFIERLEKDLKTIAKRFQEEFRQKGMAEFELLQKAFLHLLDQKVQLERPGLGEGVSIHWEEIRLIKSKARFDENDITRVINKYFTVLIDSNKDLLERVNQFSEAWDNLVKTIYGEDQLMGVSRAGYRYNNLNPNENILFHGLLEILESGKLQKHWNNYFTPKDEYFPDSQ